MKRLTLINPLQQKKKVMESWAHGWNEDGKQTTHPYCYVGGADAGGVDWPNLDDGVKALKIES
jgi:hypothetical protein|tara:strand:- start:126 stop:314 length:189 start_codon:yes stop_codon:yes gene_type:complete